MRILSAKSPEASLKDAVAYMQRRLSPYPARGKFTQDQIEFLIEFARLFPPTVMQVYPWFVKQVGNGAFPWNTVLGIVGAKNPDKAADEMFQMSPVSMHLEQVADLWSWIQKMPPGHRYHEKYKEFKNLEGLDGQTVFDMLPQMMEDYRESQKPKWEGQPLWQSATHRSEDGDKNWTIWPVETPKDLRREGRLHNNCLGTYVWDSQAGLHRFYSLRDHKDMPLLSIRMNPQTHGIEEMRGYRNARPEWSPSEGYGEQTFDPRYEEAVREFLEEYYSTLGIENPPEPRQGSVHATLRNEEDYNDYIKRRQTNAHAFYTMRRDLQVPAEFRYLGGYALPMREAAYNWVYYNGNVQFGDQPHDQLLRQLQATPLHGDRIGNSWLLNQQLPGGIDADVARGQISNSGRVQIWESNVDRNAVMDTVQRYQQRTAGVEGIDPIHAVFNRDTRMVEIQGDNSYLSNSNAIPLVFDPLSKEVWIGGETKPGDVSAIFNSLPDEFSKYMPVYELSTKVAMAGRLKREHYSAYPRASFEISTSPSELKRAIEEQGWALTKETSGNGIVTITIEGQQGQIERQGSTLEGALASALHYIQRANMMRQADIQWDESIEENPSHLFIYYRGVLNVEDYSESTRYRDMIEKLLKDNNKKITDQEVSDGEISSGRIYKRDSGMDIELESLADADTQTEALTAIRQWAEGINLVGPIAPQKEAAIIWQ